MAQNNITHTLEQRDDNGGTLARRQFTISESDPDAGEFRAGVLTTTAEATITLPFATIRQVLVRNTHATATLLVKWTPNGGAEATVMTLGPGGTVTYWDDSAVATGLGITSLKLTASIANTTYELFIGG